MTINEFRVRVPGYVGPELRFKEGETHLVWKQFDPGKLEHDEVCRRARAWLVPGVNGELLTEDVMEHVLVVEAGLP